MTCRVLFNVKKSSWSIARICIYISYTSFICICIYTMVRIVSSKGGQRPSTSAGAKNSYLTHTLGVVCVQRTDISSVIEGFIYVFVLLLKTVLRTSIAKLRECRSRSPNRCHVLCCRAAFWLPVATLLCSTPSVPGRSCSPPATHPPPPNRVPAAHASRSGFYSFLIIVP